MDVMLKSTSTLYRKNHHVNKEAILAVPVRTSPKRMLLSSTTVVAADLVSFLEKGSAIIGQAEEIRNSIARIVAVEKRIIMIVNE